jgi:hypothetical protein
MGCEGGGFFVAALKKGSEAILTIVRYFTLFAALFEKMAYDPFIFGRWEGILKRRFLACFGKPLAIDRNKLIDRLTGIN